MIFISFWCIHLEKKCVQNTSPLKPFYFHLKYFFGIINTFEENSRKVVHYVAAMSRNVIDKREGPIFMDLAPSDVLPFLLPLKPRS